MLKPKGTLRIAVPNFDCLLDVYCSTGTLERILAPLFGRMPILTLEREEVLYHKTVYTMTPYRKFCQKMVLRM